VAAQSVPCEPDLPQLRNVRLQHDSAEGQPFSMDDRDTDRTAAAAAAALVGAIRTGAEARFAARPWTHTPHALDVS
jgi:hypothetical protein